MFKVIQMLEYVNRDASGEEQGGAVLPLVLLRGSRGGARGSIAPPGFAVDFRSKASKRNVLKHIRGSD